MYASSVMKLYANACTTSTTAATPSRSQRRRSAVIGSTIPGPEDRVVTGWQCHSSMPTDARGERPIPQMLGTGTLAGSLAGIAAGWIDAVWSWSPAGQFVPGFGSRLRFVLYSGFALAVAGALIGFVAAAV